jgi:hypothetical protein
VVNRVALGGGGFDPGSSHGWALGCKRRLRRCYRDNERWQKTSSTPVF